MEADIITKHEDDMSRPRKATLIEAAEYFESRASSKREAADDLRSFGNDEMANESDSMAKMFERWAKHIKAAAEQA